MSTNYYATRVKCSACGTTQKLHIGKSSAGWCFALHVWNPSDAASPADFEQWVIMLVVGEWTIVSEYGITLSLGDLISIIADRKMRHADCSPFDFEANSAMPGPNGLARASISKGHCIAHGAGTWDLIVGEFC